MRRETNAQEVDSSSQKITWSAVSKKRTMQELWHDWAFRKNEQNGKIWQLRRKGTLNINARMRRVNLIGREDNQSETGSEIEEDNMVLHVNGSGNQPFVMKGKMNKETFTAMINSGSFSLDR